MNNPANTEDAADVGLRLVELVKAWVILQRLQTPEPPPVIVAANVFHAISVLLSDDMGVLAVRHALLYAYEQSYVQPMTQAMTLMAGRDLFNLSQARRRAAGEPSIILPGEPH